MKTTDAIEALKNGDDSAFEIIFNEYKNDLFFFALKITKSREIAEEVVQETFLAMYQSIEKLQNIDSFKSWLFSICHNQCYKYIKKENNDVLLDEDTFNIVLETSSDGSSDLPEELLEAKMLKSIMVEMFDSLPQSQREAMILYYYKEMPVSDISDIMQVPVGTVKSYLNYGRKKIKQSVGDYEQANNVRLHGVSMFALMHLLQNGSENSSISSDFISNLIKSKNFSSKIKTNPFSNGTNIQKPLRERKNMRRIFWETLDKIFSKTGRRIMGAIAGTAIVVGAVSFGNYVSKEPISFSSLVEYEYSGLNGHAHLTAYIDRTNYIDNYISDVEDYSEKIKKGIELSDAIDEIELKISKSDNLKNGDTVKITPIYDKKYFSEHGFRLTNKEIYVDIYDLVDPVEIDVFDYVDVKFSGVSNSCSIKIDKSKLENSDLDDKYKNFLTTIGFSYYQGEEEIKSYSWVDDIYKLKNGDKIEVKLSYSEIAANDAAVIVKKDSKKVSVKGLNEYLENGHVFTAAEKELISEKLDNDVQAAMSKNLSIDFLLPMFYYSNSRISNVEKVKNVFVCCQTENGEFKNQVGVIFKATANIYRGNKNEHNFEYYYYGALQDVCVDTNGNLVIKKVIDPKSCCDGEKSVTLEQAEQKWFGRLTDAYIIKEF